MITDLSNVPPWVPVSLITRGAQGSAINSEVQLEEIESEKKPPRAVASKSSQRQQLLPSPETQNNKEKNTWYLYLVQQRKSQLLFQDLSGVGEGFARQQQQAEPGQVNA